MNEPLIVIPCGAAKVWKAKPLAGPTRARHAYIGQYFQLNLKYAEHFAPNVIRILSAKYGFIEPDFIIEEDYNVTFTRKASKPVATPTLINQILEQRLFDNARIIGLGGHEYRTALATAFQAFNKTVEFPFAGLPLGLSMQAVKRALATDTIYPPKPDGTRNL